ncbi:MAG: molybdopterin-dependent oxidoreductase [Pseudomonadota bacterium]
MLRAFVFCWIALVSFPVLAEDESAPKPEGMVLLTVGGLVGKSNRGPLDPDRDSTLASVGADFKNAYAFDRDMLLALPQGTVTVKPTGWDQEAVFKGPYLRDVLVAIEAAKVKTCFVALGGYSGFLLPEDIDGSDYIIALEADGKPLGLNGYGPLWLLNEREGGISGGDNGRGSHVWSLIYMHLGE